MVWMFNLKAKTSMAPFANPNKRQPMQAAPMFDFNTLRGLRSFAAYYLFFSSRTTITE